MMSKAPRWHETLATKPPVQKTGGKEPASNKGKQAGSSTHKTSANHGRSNSLGCRGKDSAASSGKAGGSLKRGSLSHQDHQGTRPASRPSRPAFRLCSSRSFSSLHTSSLTSATFMRSSRSLSRLDQRSTGNDSDKKKLSSGRLSSSTEQIRDRDQRRDDEKMKTSSSSEPLESPSTLVSTTACHHQSNKVQKQELKRSAPDISCPSLPRYQRHKASAVPDPLNFKKGWMMRRNASGQWQKHWFVLTNQILRFYKDSVAEEAADVDGEINLSTCFGIKDYPAQENCGFQLHTRDGVYTLCAMTSGMRRNWVQAVLKNVRSSLAPDVTSSLSEESIQLKSQHPDWQSAEGLEKAEHSDSFLQEHKTSDSAKETHQQQKNQELKLQPETEQRSADGSSVIASSHLSSPSSPSSSSAPSPVNPPQQVEEGGGASRLLVATKQTGSCDPDVSETSLCVEGAGSDSCTSNATLSNIECFDKHSDTLEQQVKTQSEEQQGSINVTCERKKEESQFPSEQRTGQLVKELEQTQKELSRLQQLNRNLQAELQQERARSSKERVHPQSERLSNSEQALALQRLQKMNQDLRFQLEAQSRSHEEAREDELRWRVDLLAQQAQLLVTGDATALAQAHLEQDRRRFHEQQMEWEGCVASLKSQLTASEEQRREAEARFTQLKQELQSYHSLQQEAEGLHRHLQEVTTQLQANEESQAQKDARLEKHLMLLQASQDRERRKLATSLTQAEQHAQDLQERLDRAEEQVDNLKKTQTWSRDIEEAQHQLQEELACTVSAVQKLQEERDELDRRCQDLQNQLYEADGEVSRLQSRLKTDETHYYNLEHSYERVSEDLQLALGTVQQKETEMQDMREGYERLLDRKEQELSEVLLKMEVLGNSLEETEVKLNDVLKQNERQTTDCATVNNDSPKAIDGGQSSNSSNAVDHAGDPERFMSEIQILESKLYVTEEKLRDIMQRLEEHQSHIGCQDPHLCSQLTQSRATAQHLSLLLHSQAKQSQRFAVETENRCRMLVGRFQVALNIIQACRETLQGTPVNIIDFEKQLATVAACLQQGEKEAEKQQQESHNATKGEDKILNDEMLAEAESNINAESKRMNTSTSEESVKKYLMREVFVVEKMVSILRIYNGVGQLSSAPRDDEGDLAHKYKSLILQRIALKTEQGRGEGSGGIERAIRGVCAEAELIYSALKFQQQYESMTQVNNQEVEVQRKSLADINPPELAPYEEQVQADGRDTGGAATPAKDEFDVQKVEAEKEPEWLERLISRLQRRANFLHQLCQEFPDGSGPECGVEDNWENASAADVRWMQEQAKMIYLSDRLHSDLEQQQCEALQDKLEALRKDQRDEQESFNDTLCQLQEDNSLLREELQRAEQNVMSVEMGNKRLLEDMQKIKDHHEEQMKSLETEFQGKIRELQQIHEEEMKHLHGYYTQSSKEKQTRAYSETPESTSSHSDQTVTLTATKEAHQKENPESSCDHSFTAMEKMHKQMMDDLQQQHQTEMAAILKEKDKLLQEETSATMAAIVAMRRAHKQELERSRQSQHIKESADITQLHNEYEKEIQLMRKELEFLSVQHTQKCLENSKLSQELHDERRSLMRLQKEHQELKNTQREMDEMSQLNVSLNGKQSHVAHQVNDLYEMEVILRAREAEMQFLRHEARSLREELKVARMDKIYAQNKLKALYMNNQDEAHREVNKLLEDVKFATWSPSRETSQQNLEDTVTNTSNAAFLKKNDKSSLTRQIRGVRSKSLKEGLSVQERMKLFESF